MKYKTPKTLFNLILLFFCKTTKETVTNKASFWMEGVVSKKKVDEIRMKYDVDFKLAFWR